MVPDIEKVRCKSDILVFSEVEILDQREIPVLLVRTAVGVAPQVAKTSNAIVRIAGAVRANSLVRRKNSSRLEVIEVDVESIQFYDASTGKKTQLGILMEELVTDFIIANIKNIYDINEHA